jgi:hypothetical protein
MDFIASAAAADVRAVSVKVYLARTEAPKARGPFHCKDMMKLARMLAI